MSDAKRNISDETRRKISEAGKGLKQSEEQKRLAGLRFKGNRYRAKPIAQYDFDGHFIKAWGCAKDVETEIGIDHGNIGSCCTGNVKRRVDINGGITMARAKI